MPRNVVFYVSGHGYGHAARTAEVIRALITLGRADNVYVRTHAPREFFPRLPGVHTPEVRAKFDSGVVETTPLLVSETQTFDALSTLLERQQDIVEAQVRFAKDADVGLVVSDVPFLAGDVAEALGVPCLAVGNFTWDWIYEAYIGRSTHWADAIDQVRHSYRKMTAWLRLPFHHKSACFQTIIDVPLVARRGASNRAELSDAFDLDATDSRPRVLLAMRGQADDSILAAAAASSKDFLYLTVEPVSDPGPENVRSLSPSTRVNFIDALSLSDIVISKLGYSIIADCISYDTRILWPRRYGFREDDLLADQAPCYVRAAELPKENYDSGNWGAHLRSLMEMPAPAGRIAVNGAETCAQHIADWLT